MKKFSKFFLLAALAASTFALIACSANSSGEDSHNPESDSAESDSYAPIPDFAHYE